MNIKGNALTKTLKLRPAVRAAVVKKIDLPSLLSDFIEIAPNKVYQEIKDSQGNAFYAVITLTVGEKSPLQVEPKDTAVVEIE